MLKQKYKVSLIEWVCRTLIRVFCMDSTKDRKVFWLNEEHIRLDMMRLHRVFTVVTKFPLANAYQRRFRLSFLHAQMCSKSFTRLIPQTVVFLILFSFNGEMCNNFLTSLSELSLSSEKSIKVSGSVGGNVLFGGHFGCSGHYSAGECWFS